jgi:DNA polymerase-3 subunit gamma/tau
MTKETQNVFRASALKYRPQTLSQVIGQDVLVQTLENSFKNKRLAHAYIFTGVRGVGKTSTARLLARGLNCVGLDGKGHETPNPCGQCTPCQDITNERTLDVIEIDAASQTGVDDVRQLIENVSYKPVSGRYKVYIIDEVHMLSKSAFNALLKTLEEPPAHTKFFFATTEIDKVPMTILSRCQRFDLRRVPEGTLKKHLKNLLEQEGVESEEAALDLLIEAAEGSVRDALSLMDQAINQTSGALNATIVEQMLGYARHRDVSELLDLILKGHPKESLALFQSLYEKGTAPLSLCNRLLHSIHKLSLAISIENKDRLNAKEKEMACSLSLPTLTRLWQTILKGIEEIKASPQEAVAMEMLIIRLCYLHPLPDLVDLALSTLKPNEKKKSESINSPSFSKISTAKPPQENQTELPQIPEKKILTAQQKTDPLTSKEEIPTPPSQHLTDEALVQLAYDKKEPVLASHLLQSIAIIECEYNSLSYKPLKPLPANFEKDLQKKLTNWLGIPFKVYSSDSDCAQSLHEKKQDARKKMLQEYEKSDTFKKLKGVFPNAKPIEIQERTSS